MAAGLDINAYALKVQAMLNDLPEGVQRINDGLALSAIPLIVNRLVDLGVDGKGKKLGNYSTNPLPTFFYLHKGTGSGADAKLDALVKKRRKEEGEAFKGISYKEFREINNRPTNFITLSFTGETLGDLGVTNNVVNGLVVVTTVAAQNKVSKAKYDAKGNNAGQITTEQILDYLGERFGENILALSEEEEEQMANAYDIELQKFINQHLGT